jgi:hypothetical protein
MGNKNSRHMSKKDGCDHDAYYAAFDLVADIENRLTGPNGRSGVSSRHYRDGTGRLLWTLDQVVNAILADDLRAE